MLIENGTVVTVDPADRVLSPGWIRIADGAIREVSAAPLAPEPGEERLDASDRVVMPGLVNAHTHLYQVLIRGIYEGLPFTDWLARIYACGPALREADAAISARLGAFEALRSGTTTIVEHHFLNATPGLPAATLQGLRSMGIRSVFARTAIDMADLAPAEDLETPEEAVRACEDLLAGVGATGDDPLVSIWVGPNTPGVSASGDMVLAMAALAADRGLRQSMHVAESRASLDAVRRRYGVDGIVRWLDNIGGLQGPILAAHSVHLDPDELALMAERGVAISHNPVSNLFLGDGIAPILGARSAGVTVALGTDGASSNNRQDMFEVLKVAALLQRGANEDALALQPPAALRLATIEGARALGLDGTIGSIEAGKRADLVILDLLGHPATVALHDPVSQLVHCAPSAAVSTVLVDGVVRLRDGHLVDVDEAALLAEAQQAGRALVGRLES